MKRKYLVCAVFLIFVGSFIISHLYLGIFGALLESGNAKGINFQNFRGRLTATDLSQSTFYQVIWVGAWISNSALRDTKFYSANLDGTKFKSCDLRKATFINSSLRATDFTFSDLRGASFENCDLSLVNFTGADLSGVHVDAKTVWPISVEATRARGVLIRRFGNGL